MDLFKPILNIDNVLPITIHHSNYHLHRHSPPYKHRRVVHARFPSN